MFRKLNMPRWSNPYTLMGLSTLSLAAAVALQTAFPIYAQAVTDIASSSLSPGCEMPSGWDQVVERKPRFIVFGELHGTREAPAFVGNVACALATRGERLLIAVEHSSMYDAAFQSAWDLPHAQFAAAIRDAGWAGREDGVGSEAMMDLVTGLHSLKEEGMSIHIVAFNGARDEAQREKFSHLPGQGPHEAAQAENIRMAAEAKPYDHVLVLVGNIHARKLPVERGGSFFEPMVMHLGPRETIVTLDMKTSGGTSWACILKPGVTPEDGEPLPADAIECGSQPWRGIADIQQAPFVSLTAFPGIEKDENFDGFFWLGAVSASPPAVPRP